MSRKEIDRHGIIVQVINRKLTQKAAAGRLGLSVRQVKRLVQRYRVEGAAGLISRRRGQRPNNAIDPSVRQAIMALVQQNYADFGPTLACEKLAERHNHHVSIETLRQWMVADGLWTPRARRQARIHPHRPRRAQYGELIQIDGSPHDWFEGRGPRCTLIVFIDDATSQLMALRFVPAETTQAYMETLGDYLRQHGRPVACYSDKHSIFRVNHPEREGELTQFTRALKTLDIEPIHANSPQAKGRVERANQTLQDRLVKELRLAGINDMEAANAFLPAFIEACNARFAVAPRHPVDAHRDVLHSQEELDLILSLHHTRTLSKNLSLQFKNKTLQIQGKGSGYRLRGARITVCEAFDGSLVLLHEGRALDYRILEEGESPIPLDDEKSLHLTVDLAQQRQRQNPAWKPAPDHPWRRTSPSRHHPRSEPPRKGTFLLG